MLIDTHCHLTAKEYEVDTDAVITRALHAGVGRILCIADDVIESKKGLDLAEKYEHIFCTIGVHPHKAVAWDDSSAKKLTALLQFTKKIKAIGEIGLDYHYDFCDRAVQRAVLTEQIKFAIAVDLPIVLHNRDSWDDLWGIVQELRPKKAVLHCCTEPWGRVEQWLDAGYNVSFTGMATFPAASVIHDAIKRIPLERLMLETDGPYLAPVPHRGKRNEPGYLPHIAEAVATLKGVTVQEVAEVTTKSAVEFFSL